MGPQKSGQQAKKKFNKRMMKLNKDGFIARAPGKSRGRNWQKRTASEAFMKDISAGVNEAHHQFMLRKQRTADADKDKDKDGGLTSRINDTEESVAKRKKGEKKPLLAKLADWDGDQKPINWNGQKLQPLNKRFYVDPAEEADAAEVLHCRQSLGVKVQQNIQECPPPVTSSSGDGLTEHFEQYMTRAKFENPTPIQSQAWTAILSGRDVIGIAPTGSGKTLAYMLPAVVHAMAMEESNGQLEKGEGPIVLVLVPTRELAGQVRQMCRLCFNIWGLRSVELLGGQKKGDQRDKLNAGAFAIVAATPGRLVDLVTSEELSLERVSYLVLDECDNLLKMGFESQLTEIITRCRPDRQTIMCSATFKGPVQEASARWMTQPVIKVRVVPVPQGGFVPKGGAEAQVDAGVAALAQHANANAVSCDVTQIVRVCNADDAFDKLLDFVGMLYGKEKEEGARNLSKILVFVNKKDVVMDLAKSLQPAVKKFGANVVGMSGHLAQEERKACMQAFRSGKASIMVSTDLLGRGTDVKMLDFVVNYEFPSTLEQYVHRVGRTGRQGRKGHALSFLSPERTDIAAQLADLLRSGEQRVDPKLIKMAKVGKKAQREQAKGERKGKLAERKERERKKKSKGRREDKKSSHDDAELAELKDCAADAMRRLAHGTIRQAAKQEEEDDRWGGGGGGGDSSDEARDGGYVKRGRGGHKTKARGMGKGKGGKGKGRGDIPKNRQRHRS